MFNVKNKVTENYINNAFNFRMIIISYADKTVLKKIVYMENDTDISIFFISAYQSYQT